MLEWIPLRCLIESPQFEKKLKIWGFSSPFLHCSKPGAFYVKDSLYHLKLIQTCFINIFLLHYVQLWIQQEDCYAHIYPKYEKKKTTWKGAHISCDLTWHVLATVNDPCQQNTKLMCHVITHFPNHTSPFTWEKLGFIISSTVLDSHCRDACHVAGSRTADDPVSHSALKLYCADQSLDQSKRCHLKASEEINFYCHSCEVQTVRANETLQTCD